MRKHADVADVVGVGVRDGDELEVGGLDAKLLELARKRLWPAAFFVGGDKQTAAELSQMKGQMIAVEQASIAKKCNIQFQGKPPDAT